MIITMMTGCNDNGSGGGDYNGGADGVDAAAATAAPSVAVSKENDNIARSHTMCTGMLTLTMWRKRTRTVKPNTFLLKCAR